MWLLEALYAEALEQTFVGLVEVCLAVVLCGKLLQHLFVGRGKAAREYVCHDFCLWGCCEY